jgi:hypothetical protein
MIRARHSLALLPAFWLLFAPVTARGDESANWKRLRAMPREQREALVEKLHEFESLGAADQAGIRALDEKLAKLPPADRARYYSVMRRYFLWLEGLSEAQRKALSEAPPDQRMKLAAKLRAEERASAPRRASPPVLRFAQFGPMTPLELAKEVKVWEKASTDQRRALEKLTAQERVKRVRDLQRELHVQPPNPITQAQEDSLLAQMDAELNDAQWAPALLKAGLKKKENAKEAKEARKRHIVAVNYYFLKNPPQAVKAERLLQFETSLPSWIRSSFDYLPPDEARRRLTILYRLVYPFPEEIPRSQPAAAAKTSAPKPAPAAAPAVKGKVRSTF